MQRVSRLIVPRLSVLGGLASLALVLHGLSLLQPVQWSAPSLVATEGGFLVAWLDGVQDRVPLRVQALDADLARRGGMHTVGSGWASGRIALDRSSGRDTRVRLVGDPAHPPWRVLATIDDAGRPRRRSSLGRDWPAEIRPMPIAVGALPTSCCRSIATGAPVRDAGGKTRARLDLAPGGWARVESVPAGAPAPRARLGPAICPGLSSGPCLAAAADERGVVVAWTRNRALGSELVVTRLSWGADGPREERVVRRSPSFPLAVAFAGLVGLIAGLIGHALSGGLEASRVLLALRRRRDGVWMDGRLDRPAELVEGCEGSGYRMRTGPGWLQSEGGRRLGLRPGAPLVVTQGALLGEIPSLAAAVATFEHVWVSGRLGAAEGLGPYRGGGGRALQIDLLSDRPLPVVRAAMLGRLLWCLVDASALASVAVGAFAAIL